MPSSKVRKKTEQTPVLTAETLNAAIDRAAELLREEIGGAKLRAEFPRLAEKDPEDSDREKRLPRSFKLTDLVAREVGGAYHDTIFTNDPAECIVEAMRCVGSIQVVLTKLEELLDKITDLKPGDRLPWELWTSAVFWFHVVEEHGELREVMRNSFWGDMQTWFAPALEGKSY